MADLFQSSKQNINHHIQCIYQEDELAPEATVKKYLTILRAEHREVSRPLDYYNMVEQYLIFAEGRATRRPDFP